MADETLVGNQSLSQHIVAFDPGVTTGYVVWWEDTNTYEVGTFLESEKVDALVCRAKQVIVERPFLGSMGVNTVVFEVYGAIKERCRHYQIPYSNQGTEIPSFIYKRYSEAKDAVRRKHPFLGSDKEHKRDAFAHLLYYLTHERSLPLSWLLESFEIAPCKTLGSVV